MGHQSTIRISCVYDELAATSTTSPSETEDKGNRQDLTIFAGMTGLWSRLDAFGGATTRQVRLGDFVNHGGLNPSLPWGTAWEKLLTNKRRWEKAAREAHEKRCYARL